MTNSKTITLSNHVLDDTATDMLRKLARGEGNASKLKAEAVAYMRGTLGFVSTDLMSPKAEGATSTPESFAALKARALATLPVPVQKLFAADSNEVNNVKVASGWAGASHPRPYWVKQPNAIVGKWRKALADAEQGEVKQEYADLCDAAEAAGKKAPAKPASLQKASDRPVSERVQTLLSDAVKYIRAHDADCDFQNIGKVIVILANASDDIKKLTTVKA